MSLLPEKIIEIDLLQGELIVWYKQITQYEVFKELLAGSDLKVADVSKDIGKITIDVSKDKLQKFLAKVEYINCQEQYKMKYIALRDRIGDAAVHYLMTRETLFDPDLLLPYLPSKELIEEDMKLWHKTIDVSCGYYATDEGVLSLELAKKMAMGESIDEYPEQLEYHYYWYPDKNKSVCLAPFTKTEFLESVKKEQLSLRKKG